MLTRRDLLRSAGAIAATSAAMPSFAFANVESEARLVVVVLRGALDGLAVAAPYGDGNYRRLRGELALPEPGDDDGLLKLDGMFGLHPALPGIYDAYQNKQALIVHAIASPYRERSHFDGQDVLENGAQATGLLRDGWLNRALTPLGGTLGNELAIAMAQNTPLLLRGANSVTSWAPSQLPDADDDTIRRLQAMYADDEFFSTRLTQALKSQSIAADQGDMQTQRLRVNESQQWLGTMQATAKFLTVDEGPRIAVLEASGWDTHANQGAATGSLANKLGGLDAALAALREGLGETWAHTVVAVVTEFGRTVRVNGTLGTDHGTATTAILLGGAVNGGQIVTDWPGLGKKELYDGRDLLPTADTRSLFKAVLTEHMQLPGAFVDRVVFPDSSNAVAMRDLIKG